MIKIIVFGIAAIFILLISLKQLKNFSSHGFYRFFVFELLILLLYFNIDYWIDNPFTITQLISWGLLIFSIYPVVSGLYFLKIIGKPSKEVESETDFAFEKTTTLVTSGIFKYIRHPMYSSLLFLSWGAYLKHPNILSLILALLITMFIYLTARIEEKENTNRFGDDYLNYMKSSKMFIPYLF